MSFDEKLGLAGVTRAGVDKSCGDLILGKQEQLAILTRLAFADLLMEDGAPISLILDVPLVYSDAPLCRCLEPNAGDPTCLLVEGVSARQF